MPVSPVPLKPCSGALRPPLASVSKRAMSTSKSSSPPPASPASSCTTWAKRRRETRTSRDTTVSSRQALSSPQRCTLQYPHEHFGAGRDAVCARCGAGVAQLKPLQHEDAERNCHRHRNPRRCTRVHASASATANGPCSKDYLQQALLAVALISKQCRTW
eukprot:scaffold182_cov350-Prasinococcus_capsulatus_cf.AAC.23